VVGARFRELEEKVAENIWAYVNACSFLADKVASRRADDHEDLHLDEAIRAATIAVSLLGFMDAAAAQADFWRAGGRLALIRRLRDMLSDSFLVAVEKAFSAIRNTHQMDKHAKEWKRYLRHYSATGRPLGAMLLQRSFSWLLVSATSLLVADEKALRTSHILDILMSGQGRLRPLSPKNADGDFRSIELYSSFVAEQMSYLESTSDFDHQLASNWQQRLAFSVKASALIGYLNCSVLNDEIADMDVLMGWLEEVLADPIQMADETLASVVLQCMALACRISPALSSSVSRMLPRFIVQSATRASTIAVAAKSLAFVLQMLSKDAVITTLYTLGNVLSPGTDGSLANGVNGDVGHESSHVVNLYAGRHSTGSSISVQLNGEEDTTVVYGNVIQAVCAIADACRDEKITNLAQSILLQKLEKVNHSVDVQIITGAAALALKGGQLEFRSLLKMYLRLCHSAVVENRDFILDAVLKARNHISANLQPESPLFDIYWEHMLDSIISIGDVHRSSHTKESDVQQAAREIEQFLQPLAIFMSSNDLSVDTITEDDTHTLLRDAWFNIVVHGFLLSSERGQKNITALRIIAVHSPPLVAEQRGEQVESDIELNTVLRRGMSSDREAMQKKHLADLIPSKANEIKSLSYRKVIFLQSAYLVESLRADAGDCTKALTYFVEPSMRSGAVSSTMESVADAVVQKYLKKTLHGTDPTFTAQYVALQLASIFCNCCHRIFRVQEAAFACADRIIREVPSAMCHRSSLFALLELLSLMWSSCLEEDTVSYDPESSYSSSLGSVTVELSHDYDFRRSTLNRLNRKAKEWVSDAINLAPLDVKGLLQTYLSEFNDEGAYGHTSLGRSFALELGSFIPCTDQRLRSLDGGGIGDSKINTASDFVAQYTTRQEYRYGEILPDRGTELMSFMHLNRRASFSQSSPIDSANAATALAHIEARLLSKKATRLGEVRDILRRAAALLCRSNRDESAVAHYLVSIPFAMFTKQSIKLGVSLWLGVMNENPRLEPRLLTEIAQQWEMTIQRRLGLFNAVITHPDPFFLKKEFAPSDMETVSKRREMVHNLLSPHARLLQFLASHFNATRLGSPDIQRVFLRLLDVTLDAVRDATPHPLAREIRLQLSLLSLRVLRASRTIGTVAETRLKDKILSAALGWFKFAPRYSFGSNMLQVKTELGLLVDVIAAMKLVTPISSHTLGHNIRAMQFREQLLMLLLENEHDRLAVWKDPLSLTPKVPSFGNQMPKPQLDQTLVPLVRTAWAQHPSLAIAIAARFPLPRVYNQVRWLLLNHPAVAVDEPEALPILFGGQLPEDVNFLQLKVCFFSPPAAPPRRPRLY
jgi:phosphatidylinositol 4-kinase A